MSLLIIDVSMEVIERLKVQHIANKVVGSVCYDSITWNNGMRAKASMQAVHSSANAMLRDGFAKNGLGTPQNVQLTFVGNCIQLSFRLPGRKTILSAFCIGPARFPQKVTACGIVPADSPPAYLTIALDNNLSQSVVVPAYGVHGGSFTNATVGLQGRLKQGISGYARLLPNRQDYYGICQINHQSQSASYDFTKWRN